MNEIEITTSNYPEYDQLLLNAGAILEQGRQQAVYAVITPAIKYPQNHQSSLYDLSVG